MKKFPRLDIGWLLLWLSVAGLVALAIFLLARAFEPPRVEWKSLRVDTVYGSTLTIDAETIRRSTDGCSTGVQADLRSGGSITRLSAPVRTLSGDHSRYDLVLPVLPEGLHQVQLREIANCGGEPEVNETPWISFWVRR